MFGVRLKKRERERVGREQAMAACPVQCPPQKTERKDGKLYVTIGFERPAWQRLLGAERECSRTFGLDAYGQEVYAKCDGRTPVKAIVKTFASRHHLSEAEARIAVAAFMKTLMRRGLIGMVVARSDR